MARKRYYNYMDNYNSKNNSQKMYYADRTKKAEKEYGSNLIYNDYNATANLPQESIKVDFAKPTYGQDRAYVKDTVEAQDNQISSDRKQMYNDKANQKYPEKY